MVFPLDVTRGNMVPGALNGTLMRGATVIPGLVDNAVYIGGNWAYVGFGTRKSVSPSVLVRLILE